jgi:hypothetical protein
MLCKLQPRRANVGSEEVAEKHVATAAATHATATCAQGRSDADVRTSVELPMGSSYFVCHKRHVLQSKYCCAVEQADDGQPARPSVS